MQKIGKFKEGDLEKSSNNPIFGPFWACLGMPNVKILPFLKNWQIQITYFIILHDLTEN